MKGMSLLYGSVWTIDFQLWPIQAGMLIWCTATCKNDLLDTKSKAAGLEMIAEVSNTCSLKELRLLCADSVTCHRAEISLHYKFLIHSRE